jgi:hypothetical protein
VFEVHISDFHMHTSHLIHLKVLQTLFIAYVWPVACEDMYANKNIIFSAICYGQFDPVPQMPWC